MSAPEKIRAVVLDLDRTLLRTDKTLSEYSLSVLMECRKRGIKLVVATARSMRVTRQYDRLIIPDAAVYNNGAVVEIGGERRRALCLDTAEGWGILRGLQRRYPHATLSAEAGERLFANFAVPESWGRETTVFSDFSDLPQFTELYKILVGGVASEELKKIGEALPDRYHIELADYSIGLILRREATKLNGLKEAFLGLGVSMSAAAAFGDDRADIEMLRECGVGVAVSNALPEVKSAADHITLSNDEDGAAVWIKQQLLGV